MNYRTVEELENSMSLRELYDWYEYYNNEPFFADRIEIQLATVCTMIAGFGSKSKPKHDDFMIRKKEKPVLSQAEKNRQLITAFKSI